MFSQVRAIATNLAAHPRSAPSAPGWIFFRRDHLVVGVWHGRAGEPHTRPRARARALEPIEH
jgi:hypothetical protein